MKTLRLILILFLMISRLSIVFSDEAISGNFHSLSGSVTFEENNFITMELDYPRQISVTEKYEIVVEDFMTFLVTDSGRYLCLFSNPYIVIFDSEGWPFFTGVAGSAKLKHNFGRANQYFSDSFLEEGKRLYLPENMGTLETFKPWVEGQSDYGIGERISLRYQGFANEGMNGILIFNGFVSYDKPYLYAKNGRVKEIKIFDSDENVLGSFLIEDTPNPQFIELSRSATEISMVIEEVYEGTHWEDTCINAILCIPEEMVDFFNNN